MDHLTHMSFPCILQRLWHEPENPEKGHWSIWKDQNSACHMQNVAKTDSYIELGLWLEKEVERDNIK